jgi:hypothetical protein
VGFTAPFVASVHTADLPSSGATLAQSQDFATKFATYKKPFPRYPTISNHEKYRIMANNSENDYELVVQQYSDEELLTKEQSKRRRKTGDVVGAGLTAAAAIRAPSLWAVAGASAKSFLNNSTKHKIILKEISRRGLTPLKGGLTDAILPVLTSAGSMVVGRSVGGAAGQGAASMAGDIMHGVSNMAFGGSKKKAKNSKKVTQVSQNDPNAPRAVQQSTAMVPASSQALVTPSSYHVPPNQTPPATLVFHYVPPSAQYPRGYYAPAQVQTASPPAQPPMMIQGSTQAYQQMPPALAYQYAPSEPQYFGNANRQVAEPVPGVYRAQTVYDAPPAYQPTIQRAHTISYRQ